MGEDYLFDMSLMSLLCVIDKMPQVLWREREIPDEVMAVVREDRWVRSMLGLFGLLKFTEVPMMWSVALLLNRLIRF